MLRSYWGQAVLKNGLSYPEFFNDEDSLQIFLVGECYGGSWYTGSVLFIVCFVQTDFFWGNALCFTCFCSSLFILWCVNRGSRVYESMNYLLILLRVNDEVPR